MYEAWGKRVFDILGALVLLLLAAPALGVTALAVWQQLGRPILFRQERAGRHGRPFTLLKFRSMAEGPEPDAMRLSRFGRLLRAAALDELPQLANVLRGEMSLVGPRPLPLDYVPLYTPRQRLRLIFRPGLAGLAQAAGRNAVPWEERLELDVRYVSTRPTFRADLAILLRSVGTALTLRGATAANHASMPPLTRWTEVARPIGGQGGMAALRDPATGQENPIDRAA